MVRRRFIFLVILLLVVIVAVPVAWYGVRVGSAPAMRARQAREMVLGGQATLVDVGLPADVPVGMATYRWPVEEILRTRGPSDFPPELRDRTLILLSSGGIESARAARHLWKLNGDGWPAAWSVNGGVQEWLAGEDLSSAPVFRSTPLYEELIALGAFFGVKTIYTVMAGWLIVKLGGKAAPDLKAWRWGLVAFFVGEAFCAVNVLGFKERSAGMEFFHCAGMVGFMGCVIYALLEGLDARLLHFSEGTCGLTGACGGCRRQAGVCGMRRLFLLLLPALALLAILPLCTEMRWRTYNTMILTQVHTYMHPIVIQMYEFRYLPVAAIGLLGAGWVRLAFRERVPGMATKMLLAAGCGALGFSLLRLLMLAAFIENQVWFAAWEELTELLMIGGIAWMFHVLPGILRAPPRAVGTA